jgi:hypothetical protein
MLPGKKIKQKIDIHNSKKNTRCFTTNKPDKTKHFKKHGSVTLTDSGLPRILATALLASLRISEVTTLSTGTLVCRFTVGMVPVARTFAVCSLCYHLQHTYSISSRL